ncbi:MAG TPA: hypothetical protein PLF65_11770 [Desulfobacter postgatei]|nr:hypothetical protein [Desulfobacter postgatei]
MAPGHKVPQGTNSNIGLAPAKRTRRLIGEVAHNRIRYAIEYP